MSIANFLGTPFLKEHQLHELHRMNSVRIRSFSGPYFRAFGLNAERYGVFRPNAGKYGPEKRQTRTLLKQC